MNIPYTLVKSKRKTMAVEITRDLRVVVRAPMRATKRDVEHFVTYHTAWITEHLARQRQRALAHPAPTQAEEAALRQRAKDYLPGRVAHYAALMGLTPTGVKVTSAKTRFGSCSGKNSLCFSYLLMGYPDAAVDYVIVHELAHIVHKNHGAAFYALIERYMPDWRARRALLKA